MRFDVVEHDEVGPGVADLEAEVATVHAGGSEDEVRAGMVERDAVGLGRAAPARLRLAEIREVGADERVRVELALEAGKVRLGLSARVGERRDEAHVSMRRRPHRQDEEVPR